MPPLSCDKFHPPSHYFPIAKRPSSRSSRGNAASWGLLLRCLVVLSANSVRPLLLPLRRDFAPTRSNNLLRYSASLLDASEFKPEGVNYADFPRVPEQPRS